MINGVVNAGHGQRDSFDDMTIHLRVAASCASLLLCASVVGADNDPRVRVICELPVNPVLGQDDPNLRVLRAMQVAAAAELERQRVVGGVLRVHVPQPLDLSDLHRFPAPNRR